MDTKHVLWLVKFDNNPNAYNIVNDFKTAVKQFNKTIIPSHRNSDEIKVIYIGQNNATVVQHLSSVMMNKLQTSNWDFTIVTNFSSNDKFLSSAHFNSFKEKYKLTNMRQIGWNLRYVDKKIEYFAKFSKFMSNSLGSLNKLNVFNLNLFENNRFPCYPLEQSADKFEQPNYNDRKVNISGFEFDKLLSNNENGFLMLNLMRISNKKDNSKYETNVVPLLFSVGGRPLLMGKAFDLGNENKNLKYWNEILLVYYPCGEAFLHMINSVKYRKYSSLKVQSDNDLFIQATKPLYYIKSKL